MEKKDNNQYSNNQGGLYSRRLFVAGLGAALVTGGLGLVGCGNGGSGSKQDPGPNPTPSPTPGPNPTPGPGEIIPDLSTINAFYDQDRGLLMLSYTPTSCLALQGCGINARIQENAGRMDTEQEYRRGRNVEELSLYDGSQKVDGLPLGSDNTRIVGIDVESGKTYSIGAKVSNRNGESVLHSTEPIQVPTHIYEKSDLAFELGIQNANQFVAKYAKELAQAMAKGQVQVYLGGDACNPRNWEYQQWSAQKLENQLRAESDDDVGNGRLRALAVAIPREGVDFGSLSTVNSADGFGTWVDMIPKGDVRAFGKLAANEHGVIEVRTDPGSGFCQDSRAMRRANRANLESRL
ncbi:hypothetical protein ACFLZX_02925 [Nanoarchaeota archaeon]